MTNEIIEAGSGEIAGDGSYYVDAVGGKGEVRGEVSAQWASRPDDEKFLSLTALRDHCKSHAENSRTYTTDLSKIEFSASAENDILIQLPETPMFTPTNWVFDQLCSIGKSPRDYLRKLPAPLAALNLQYRLHEFGAPAMAYAWKNGGETLRAINSLKYGRIFDWQVVESIMRVAGDGTGADPAFKFKVPGMFDWSAPRTKGGKVKYQPNVPVTKSTTTIYGSDRDIFVFLVDDRNPIVIGKTKNGEPDFVFRGFYVRNSEVGASKYVIGIMYLRGVCENRLLWGCEGFEEIEFRHTSGAPERFLQECQPALDRLAESNDAVFMAHVKEARKQLFHSKEETLEFFQSRKGGEWNMGQANALCALHVEEEARPIESIWDAAQAITAMARDVRYQDERISFEAKAKRLLDKVKA